MHVRVLLAKPDQILYFVRYRFTQKIVFYGSTFHDCLNLLIINKQVFFRNFDNDLFFERVFK